MEGNAVSKRRSGGEVVLDDLAPGRAPHTLVAQDVGERRVERADPVRYTNDEWMQADRHNTSRLCALAVERVELAADHELELVRRPAGAEDLRQIVDLPGVRDRAQALAPDVHQIGLVVVDPVGDVGGAGLDEVIERVPALLQAGRQPARRAPARRLLDARKRGEHDPPLLYG